MSGIHLPPGAGGPGARLAPVDANEAVAALTKIARIMMRFESAVTLLTLSEEQAGKFEAGDRSVRPEASNWVGLVGSSLEMKQRTTEALERIATALEAEVATAALMASMMEGDTLSESPEVEPEQHDDPAID